MLCKESNKDDFQLEWLLGSRFHNLCRGKIISITARFFLMLGSVTNENRNKGFFEGLMNFPLNMYCSFVHFMMSLSISTFDEL